MRDTVLSLQVTSISHIEMQIRGTGISKLPVNGCLCDCRKPTHTYGDYAKSEQRSLPDSYQELGATVLMIINIFFSNSKIN